MTGKIYIVRLWNKESDPMVGEICGSGKAGIICYDKKLSRKFYPSEQVLVDKNTNEILGLDLSVFKGV